MQVDQYLFTHASYAKYIWLKVLSDQMSFLQRTFIKVFFHANSILCKGFLVQSGFHQKCIFKNEDDLKIENSLKIEDKVRMKTTKMKTASI